MQTFDLKEAAAFLKMHPEEVRRRAKLGKVPGAKTGKSWIFLEDDLVEYVRSLYATTWQALQVTPRKEQQSCHLSNAVTRGGSTSLHQQGNEFDALLEQVIKSKRKNYTTS